MEKQLIELEIDRIKYVAWSRDPHSVATNALSVTWNKEFYYAFPPFCLIIQVLNKMGKDKKKKIFLMTPCWQAQLWYPQILSMLIREQVILPLSEKLLSNPSGQTHTLVTNQTLTLWHEWFQGIFFCERSFCQGSQSYLQFKEREFFIKL